MNPYEEVIAQQPLIQQQNNYVEPQRSKLKIWLTVGIVLVFLILVGVLVYFFFYGKIGDGSDSYGNPIIPRGNGCTGDENCTVVCANCDSGKQLCDNGTCRECKSSIECGDAFLCRAGTCVRFIS